MTAAEGAAVNYGRAKICQGVAQAVSGE